MPHKFCWFINLMAQTELNKIAISFPWLSFLAWNSWVRIIYPVRIHYRKLLFFFAGGCQLPSIVDQHKTSSMYFYRSFVSCCFVGASFLSYWAFACIFCFPALAWGVCVCVSWVYAYLFFKEIERKNKEWVGRKIWKGSEKGQMWSRYIVWKKSNKKRAFEKNGDKLIQQTL